MKKLYLFFVIAMLLSACANKPTAVAVQATAKPEGVYYFLAANNSDPFYVTGVKGFNDAGKPVMPSIAAFGA